MMRRLDHIILLVAHQAALKLAGYCHAALLCWRAADEMHQAIGDDNAEHHSIAIRKPMAGSGLI
jgi:hypothetical protein